MCFFPFIWVPFLSPSTFKQITLRQPSTHRTLKTCFANAFRENTEATTCQTRLFPAFHRRLWTSATGSSSAASTASIRALRTSTGACLRRSHATISHDESPILDFWDLHGKGSKRDEKGLQNHQSFCGLFLPCENNQRHQGTKVQTKARVETTDAAIEESIRILTLTSKSWPHRFHPRIWLMHT